MKRFFEYMGLVVIVLLSFYYTEKIALLVQSKNPIMLSIKEAAPDESVIAVNATIDGDRIIPGFNGRSVNIEKSFLKMKSFGAFNNYYLIFDIVKPKLSLEDNKDKTIIKGNKNKNAVSLIIENNESVKNFLKNSNFNFAVLSYVDNYQKEEGEQLNGEKEKNKYNDMESLLNKDKKNINICLVNTSNKEMCLKNKNYLVKETLSLTTSNLISIKSNIESGAIILIKESAKVEDVNILIKQIEYQGLKIIKLSELISESN